MTEVAPLGIVFLSPCAKVADLNGKVSIALIRYRV